MSSFTANRGGLSSCSEVAPAQGSLRSIGVLPRNHPRGDPAGRGALGCRNDPCGPRQLPGAAPQAAGDPWEPRRRSQFVMRERWITGQTQPVPLGDRNDSQDLLRDASVERKELVVSECGPAME